MHEQTPLLLRNNSLLIQLGNSSGGRGRRGKSHAPNSSSRNSSRNSEYFNDDEIEMVTDTSPLINDIQQDGIIEISDDKTPVSAYFEIVTIRSLLLERVNVVLNQAQLHLPEIQTNLIGPLWKEVRQKCGVWVRGDMRRHREHQSSDGSFASGEYCGDELLASAAMLYAALANRDYFILLASAGLSHAEFHESRANVAEMIAIRCVKALHRQGTSVLSNALCAKFTPIDTDAMCEHIRRSLHHRSGSKIVLFDLVDPKTGNNIASIPIVRGERHISLLSVENRLRVYRLGRAGDVDVGNTPGSCYWEGDTGNESPAYAAGWWSTLMDELSQEYLSQGSRILVERTLEVAVRSEAKRFTAQKLVSEIVQKLWDGNLRWKGHRCICIHNTCPKPLQEMQDLMHTISGPTLSSRINTTYRDIQPSATLLKPGSKLGQHSTFGSDTSADKSRLGALERHLASTLMPLRVPVFENALVMVHSFLFLILYTVVSLQRDPSVTVKEIVLHVCTAAYIADEIRQCTENGIVVYLKSVWNILDVSIYSVFCTFFILRINSIYTGSSKDVDKAYDVLSLNAAMLWPRLFAVLDQYEFCGTIIIQIRRIFAGASLFFALLFVMTIGFFQTFYTLALRHNNLPATEISGLMARIFFGSALLGWDRAYLFGPYVGTFSMGLYIAISMLILYNILIGIINKCMMEITDNSEQEFRFNYTMRVLEYVSAKQTYPFIPPLNILQVLVFWPLRKWEKLTPRWFSLIRSIFLVITYTPHLLFYALYKKVRGWWKEKSGMDRKALRTECRLAEKELAHLRMKVGDIEDYDFNSCESHESSVEDNGIPDDDHPRKLNARLTASQELGQILHLP